MLRGVRPDVVVGDARRRFEGIQEKEGVSGASSLAQADIASDARVFILECLGNFLRTAEWNDDILPALERESYIVDKAEILACQVEIPWRRKRTFVVGIKGGLAMKGKLAAWKRRLEKVKQPVQELGGILRQRGAYFLKRGSGERAIYSFNEPIISLNRAHIMGGKPTEGYIAHQADAARLEEVEELHFNDYTKITPGQEHYVMPQTVSKSAAASVIADFTPPPMLRAVLVGLAVQGLLGKPVPEVVELEGLACMMFEDYLSAAKDFKAELTRLAISPSFSKRPNGKEPLRVKQFFTSARAPLQKTPTESTVPASSSSMLTHVLQAASAPVVQEEDPTRRDGQVVTQRPPA